MIPFSTLPGYCGALKKILYISPFAFQVSGADESLLAVLKKIPKDRARTFVALPFTSPLIDRYRETCEKTFSMPLMRLKRSKNPLYWIFYVFYFPVEVSLFIMLIARHRIDIVHVNMESSLAPAVAAKLMRKPLVIHYRGKTVDTPKTFFDLFIPTLSFLATRILCISKASAVGFYRRGYTHKLEIFHNPVDLSKFAAASQTNFFQSYRKHKEQKIITFIGRLDPQKRIIDLLSAATLLKQRSNEFMIAIVGGDPRITEEKKHLVELESFVADHCKDISIVFLGAQKDISSILHDSNALVLPSINEGFGRVMLEAMACHTPVIVANSGALPEVIQNGTYGTLVRPTDPQDLAKALELVLNQDPTIFSKAELAKKHAETFSIDSYVQRLLQTYESFPNENRDLHRGFFA